MSSLFKAVVIGALAGMRSMSAPAIVASHYSGNRSAALDDSTLAFMATPLAVKGISTLAGGELIADKTSFIGDRVDIAPLLFRAISGGLCGAVISKAEGDDVLTGAIAGSIAAVVSAEIFFTLRRELAEGVGIPDTLLAIGEDSLVYSVGHSVLKS